MGDYHFGEQEVPAVWEFSKTKQNEKRHAPQIIGEGEYGNEPEESIWKPWKYG